MSEILLQVIILCFRCERHQMNTFMCPNSPASYGVLWRGNAWIVICWQVVVINSTISDNFPARLTLCFSLLLPLRSSRYSLLLLTPSPALCKYFSCNFSWRLVKRWTVVITCLALAGEFISKLFNLDEGLVKDKLLLGGSSLIGWSERSTNLKRMFSAL